MEYHYSHSTQFLFQCRKIRDAWNQSAVKKKSPANQCHSITLPQAQDTEYRLRHRQFDRHRVFLKVHSLLRCIPHTQSSLSLRNREESHQAPIISSLAARQRHYRHSPRVRPVHRVFPEGCVHAQNNSANREVEASVLSVEAKKDHLRYAPFSCVDRHPRNQAHSEHIRRFCLRRKIPEAAALHCQFYRMISRVSSREESMVGTKGLEPSTSRSRTVRSSQLSYVPISQRVKEDAGKSKIIV